MSRPSRERKTVERFSVETAEKILKEFEVPEGSGEQLGSIVNVEKRLNATKATDISIKRLWGVVYPNQNLVKAASRKSKLRLFKGYADDSEEFKEKMTKKIAKYGLKDIKELALCLDTTTTGSKADIVAGMIDFLGKPAASGNAYRKKVGEKKKVGSKKAGDKRKRQGKKVISSFMAFSMEKRPEVKEENPKMKFGDIAKTIGRLWKELSDEEKEEYKQKAAVLTEEANAENGEKAKTPKKAKKTTKKKATKKAKEEKETEDEEESEDEEETEMETKLRAAIKEVLDDADEEISMKGVRAQLAELEDFDKEIITANKAFIKKVVYNLMG